MKQAFDPQLAAEIGLDEAIFISQLQYWQSKGNIGRDHDGRKYIKNTLDEWLDNFPYWSMSQLRRVIRSLLDSGYIIRANLNTHGYDRTWWYTVCDEKLPTNAIVETDKCNVSESTNAMSASQQMHSLENSTTIPKTTTKTTTKSKSNTHTPAHFQAFEQQATGYTEIERPYVDVLKTFVRDPYKTVKIKELIETAIGFGLEPDDLQRMFGDRDGFWYVVSYGKKDGLPPHVQNVINDLRTAVQWESQPKNNTSKADEFWSNYMLPAMSDQSLIQEWPKEYKNMLLKIGGQRVFNKPAYQIKSLVYGAS